MNKLSTTAIVILSSVFSAMFFSPAKLSAQWKLAPEVEVGATALTGVTVPYLSIAPVRWEVAEKDFGVFFYPTLSVTASGASVWAPITSYVNNDKWLLGFGGGPEAGYSSEIATPCEYYNDSVVYCGVGDDFYFPANAWWLGLKTSVLIERRLDNSFVSAVGFRLAWTGAGTNLTDHLLSKKVEVNVGGTKKKVPIEYMADLMFSGASAGVTLVFH